MPPKPPLLMQRIWSPARACNATWAASASILGAQKAFVPKGFRASEASGVAKRQINLFQTPRQLRLHGAEFHGVGPGFEDRQNAGTANASAQPIDGGSDRGGVVRKVVINSYDIGFFS